MINLNIILCNISLIRYKRVVYWSECFKVNAPSLYRITAREAGGRSQKWYYSIWEDWTFWPLRPKKSLVFKKKRLVIFLFFVSCEFYSTHAVTNLWLWYLLVVFVFISSLLTTQNVMNQIFGHFVLNVCVCQMCVKRGNKTIHGSRYSR